MTHDDLWTAEMVIIFLEQAVRTLAALPGGGHSTSLAQPSTEIVRELTEGFGSQPEAVRPPTPSARKITEMDRILLWMALIPQEKYVLRRVVAYRAVTHYATHKPMPWSKIGVRVGANYIAVQSWHGQGISLIVRGLNRAGTPIWWKLNEPAAAVAKGETMAPLARREPVGRRWTGR